MWRNAWGWDLPPADLFGRADEETARYIAEQVLPLARHERLRALHGLLRPVVASAAEACGREAAVRLAAAGAAVRLAWALGGDWVVPLERVADRRLREAASLLIEAHGRCRAARGVARAVGLARRGEAWTPSRGRRGRHGCARRVERWAGREGREQDGITLSLGGRHGSPARFPGLAGSQSLMSQRVQAQSRP